jgi:hypothetical protein
MKWLFQNPIRARPMKAIALSGMPTPIAASEY